jgi:hypothetical protein
MASEKMNFEGVPVPPRVVGTGFTIGSVTDKIASVVLTHPVTKGWVFGFAVSFTLVNVLMMSVAWLFYRGVGIWGINIPVGWGFAIVNFVWWIGIGHAGTFISAFLLLLRQDWRTSINRFAEAMTLFAVACAGTSAVRGLRIGCCRIQIRCSSGRSSAARWFGTSLPSRHTQPFRCSSGMSA